MKAATAPPRAAFLDLHRLEGEVLELVAERWLDIELAALHKRRAAYVGG